MMRRLLSVLLAALFASLVLASCGSGDSGYDGGFGGPQVESMPTMDGAAESAPAPAEPYIIRTAYATIRTASVLDTRDAMRARIIEADGLVASEDVSDIDGLTYATLTARIPAASLDAFLAGLSELGTVEALNVGASDVTVQVMDLDARIASLNTSIARLQELQDQAATVGDLVAVESELATRTAERDGLVAQRDYLGDQVAMSTVTIRLVPDQEQTISLPNIWGSVLAGVQGLLSFIGWIISAAIVVIPTIAIIVLVVWGVRAIIRALRRS
jgi:hypothetical protein